MKNMYDRKENSIEMVTRNKLDIIPQESRNISYEKNIKPEILHLSEVKANEAL